MFVSMGLLWTIDGAFEGKAASLITWFSIAGTQLKVQYFTIIRSFIKLNSKGAGRKRYCEWLNAEWDITNIPRYLCLAWQSSPNSIIPEPLSEQIRFMILSVARS